METTREASLYPLQLEGDGVRLLPLSLEHVDALCAAAGEARDTYGFTDVPASREAMLRYIETALREVARGTAVPFVTFDKRRQRVVGATRFGNIERWTWPRPQPEPRFPEAVEIGWTWLAASAQRTHVNTEAKLLMLTHAFEVWRVRRLSLRTDARNARSRANIERVGARLDGILRAQMPAFDHPGERDTASYSILAREWPEVRERLAARLR